MTDNFETVQNGPAHSADATDLTVYVPPFYNDLEASLAHAWALLARGTADRRSPFHAPVVASVGLDGAPQQRTMILRKVDVAARTLRFNTDTRSAKWQEILKHPHVSVIGYSVTDKIQLRLSGVATLEGDSPLADNIWANMRDQSRVAYAQPASPGAEVALPNVYVPPLELRRDDPAAQSARKHFCLLTVKVECLDWVYLHLNGNRRAQFRWPADVSASCWLAP